MIEIQNEELIKKVTAEIENVNGFDQYECEFEFVGIRFENKIRKVGDIIEECSKDNNDRSDERDFPEYGSDEYNKMDELEGISTWDIKNWQYGNISEISDTTCFEAEHLYLIGGNNDGGEAPDYNELIIADGKVLAVIL